MERLKIGFVFDDSLDQPDGVQQYILALGEWLSGQGHEVHYLVGATSRHDIARVHSLSRNIQVRFNGNRLSIPLPAPRQAIRELLQTEAFDVLHVQLPYSPFMAGRIIAAAPPGTALVGTFHILPNSRLAAAGNRVLGWWLRRSLRRFQAIVSVSAAARTFARSYYGIDSTVLPNVVDYARFHNAVALPAYNGGRPTILFLGRLVPRKGCRTLLEAVNLLQRQAAIPQFRVVVCGKGPLEAELRAYAAKNHLQNIEFTGFVAEADKPRYYASADIAVFPSRGGESFGIVLLEAMAAKTAVLAGNNPGYASVIGAKQELLFTAADSRQLADKLAWLLEDGQARRGLAAWGEGYARAFDTAAVGEQLAELYRHALRTADNMR